MESAMKSSIEKIVGVGAGALGAVYASLLYDMDANCVSFLADGKRLKRLRRDGVIINDKRYDIPARSPNEYLKPAGLVIVAVKDQHLPAVLPEMRSCVGPETIIISVMNGIDSEEQIGAVYGADKALFCIALGIDSLREGNRIIYTTRGKLIFGERDNAVITDRVARLQELFGRAGIAYETPPDMMRMMWQKFMINVGINQASVILGATYGVFQTSEEARALMKSAMQEVIALAKKAGINLVAEDVHIFDSLLATLSPQGKTSMLQDVEAGRKTEVEMFAGKVIALGKLYNVPVPVNRMLFDRIRAIESKK
jgi:2-dehydropantoate 2-reductase